MNDNSFLIGDFLKKIRTEKNLTQTEISKLLGINRSTYANYEQNLREPNLSTLSSLCRVFDVDLNELIAQSSKNSFKPNKEFLKSVDMLLKQIENHELDAGNLPHHISGEEVKFLAEAYYSITKIFLKYRNYVNPTAHLLDKLAQDLDKN